MSAQQRLLMLLLLVLTTAAASWLSRGSLLLLRGGGINIDDITRAAEDPEAVEELRKLMEDPEAMAEARKMMDDPEFRAEMRDALAEGGSETLETLKASVAAGSALEPTLNQLGPSLGATLELLKESIPTADEFGQACQTLSSLASRLQVEPTDPGTTYRRLRLGNEALQARLLRHGSLGTRCLNALGFTEEVELEGGPHLAIPDGAKPDVERSLRLIAEAQSEAELAASLSAAHGIPYPLALALPHVRRACRGPDGSTDEEFGTAVNRLLLGNAEFRAHVSGPSAELALPSIVQLVRSRHGLQGLLEFYEGAPPAEGTRVVPIKTVSEWKAALDAAGARPVAALFTSSADVGCRLLAPVFARLPDSEAEAFAGVDFLRVDLSSTADDGLAAMVFAEAYVGEKEVPCVAFFSECLEHRKWRFRGADVAELVSRLKRVAAADRIDEGPG